MKEIDLEPNEWNTIKELLNILGLFAEVTQYLGSSKYVSVNFVYPIIYDFKKRFKPFVTVTDTNLNTKNDAFENNIVPEDDSKEIIESNTL